MKPYVVRCGISAIVLWGCTISSVGLAQAVQEQHVIASTREKPSMMTQAITLRLQNVLLKNALQAVEKAAKVRIYYQVELVDAVKGPVSVQAAGRTLQSVLEVLLAGTGLRATPISHGIVTIEPLGETDPAENGTVVGKVIHAKTKQPVSGARVSLGDGNTVAVTGDDGTFRLAAPAGEHSIVARSVGLVRQEFRVSVASGKTVNVEFALEPSASVLDEVIVTGTVVATERKAIPTPITVITAEELERRGVTRLEDLFRGSIPGVVTIETGSQRYYGNVLNGGGDTLGTMVTSSMFARGNASLLTNDGTANPLKVYIDGVEMVDPSYLGTIDPQSIERIEIITGPQAATIYGSGAMGGVMQIFTKKGMASEGGQDFTLRLRYGLLQNSFSDGLTPSHNHVAGLTGRFAEGFSYAANVSYTYTGQWQPDLYSRTYGASLGLSYDRGPLAASSSIGATAGSNGMSGLGNGTASSPYHLEMVERGEYIRENGYGTGRYYSPRISKSTSQTLTLNLDYRISSQWQHHLTLGRVQNNFAIVPEAPVFELPSDTLFRASSRTGSRTTLSYNSTFLHGFAHVMTSTITLGGNGSWGDILQVGGCQVNKTATSYIPCPNNSSTSVSKPRIDVNWGGFLSAQLGMWERMYLTFGLRGEQNPSYGREHRIDWTPRTGIAYNQEIGPLTMKVLASYGNATRAPDPEWKLKRESYSTNFSPEYFLSQLENNELTPQYSRGPQGGIELYYGSLFSISVNRYNQRVTDLIQRVLIDTVRRLNKNTGDSVNNYQYQYMNVGVVRQHGWESVGSLALGIFSLKGTYSWNESRVIRSRNFVEVGSSFQGVPTHTGNIILGMSSGKTTVNVITNYIGQIGRRQIDDTRRSLSPSNYRLQMYVPSRYVNTVGYSLYVVNPGYNKTDVTATQAVSDGITATLQIVNLGNSYASDASTAFPTLGRQTMMGLSLRFPRGR